MKDKKLKILFLPAWYPTERDPVNGIFTKEHAKAVSLYNDVLVLYASCDKKISGLYSKISDETEEGIRTIRLKYRKLPIPKTTFFVYLWSILVTLKRLFKESWKPDIIHAHIFEAGVPAVILGKLYTIPVVITEHWSGFPLHKLTLSYRIKARFAMNRAKFILPVTKNLEKAIKSYSIRNKFKVIPNVVNTNIFYPSSALSLNDENEKKRILIVALLSPIKGISYLLEALAQLKQKRNDFVLDIVGDGPNRGEYEELSKNLGFNETVKFHGLKPKEGVAEFMRECTFFIQPSLCETFNVACIEAMTSGKPVIATKLPVFQEKITQDSGILVPPEDLTALTKAIEYMLDHYQDYSSEKISRYARERFSYEVVGQQLNKIYRELKKKNVWNG